MIPLLILAVLGFVNPITTAQNIFETPLSIPEWIQSYGYPCEEHFVTSDGYILRMHRIPYSLYSSKPPKNQTVFLMSGLFESSADWIMTGPGKAIAYILSDEGYDIWIGNPRGNTQSRNHTHLSPDSSEFWDFSWHEIGYIDLPVMIDYILEQANQSQLFYVGHSQATTTLLVLASMKPEYNQKIIAQFGMSPVAFMNHATSPPLVILGPFSGPLTAFFSLTGHRELLGHTPLTSLIGQLFCSDGSLTQVVCVTAIFELFGYSRDEMNATLLPQITKYTPAGASTKQYVHFLQEVHSGRFRQYDYGTLGNLQKYGTLEPPDYNLTAVTLPTYLFSTHEDRIASEIDILRLYNQLPGYKELLPVNRTFNHLDYLYGIHAGELVYARIISSMAKYN